MLNKTGTFMAHLNITQTLGLSWIPFLGASKASVRIFAAWSSYVLDFSLIKCHGGALFLFFFSVFCLISSSPDTASTFFLRKQTNKSAKTKHLSMWIATAQLWLLIVVDVCKAAVDFYSGCGTPIVKNVSDVCWNAGARWWNTAYSMRHIPTFSVDGMGRQTIAAHRFLVAG